MVKKKWVNAKNSSGEVIRQGLPQIRHPIISHLRMSVAH